MRMRRAQNMAERHIGEAHVIDIIAAAAQQARILETTDRLADGELTHGVSFREVSVMRPQTPNACAGFPHAWKGAAIR